MGNVNIDTKVEQNQRHEKLNLFCKIYFVKLSKGYTCYFKNHKSLIDLIQTRRPRPTVYLLYINR